MKTTKTLFFLFILTHSLSFSQTESTLSRKEVKKNMPTFISISSGGSMSNLRDFATSPLVYNGIQKHINLSRTKLNKNREFEIGVSYNFGNYSNSFNDHSLVSEVKTLSVFYSKLYEFKKLSSDNLNIKVGGLLNITGNNRVNSSLFNNSIGQEIIPTLLGSVKISKDFNRTETKTKKFLFFRYTLSERKRNLAFRLNIGLLNNSFRNGFVYSGQAAVLNESKRFDGYEFKMFSGFRASSSLDYTLTLKNKNKLQLSYVWDAYKTGGELDQLEMAHHLIRLTFMFNTNNK